MPSTAISKGNDWLTLLFIPENMSSSMPSVWDGSWCVNKSRFTPASAANSMVSSKLEWPQPFLEIYSSAVHCADCHAAVGTEGMVNKGQEVALSGGKVFELEIGLIHPRNITPDSLTGIGSLTDAQIARSLRYGVGYDGRAMFDFMPFHSTSDEDLSAIISYIRSMPPVKNVVPKDSYNLLGKVIRAFALKPVGPDGEVLKAIKPDSTAAYGKYLATSVANCRGCHTNRDQMTGAFIGKDFSGGLEFDEKGFIFNTPNLTPDKNTGHIFGWSEDVFLQRFRRGKVYPQSPMPWGPFARMSDLEIKAIYRYLRSVEPVENKIANVVVATK